MFGSIEYDFEQTPETFPPRNETLEIIGQIGSDIFKRLQTSSQMLLN